MSVFSTFLHAKTVISIQATHQISRKKARSLIENWVHNAAIHFSFLLPTYWMGPTEW